MRQVTFRKKGGPDVLTVTEAPDPHPGKGEVRIKVAAAGINFADIMIRVGVYPNAPKFPCTVGYEIAGDIDAIGEGVDGGWQGKRVLAMTPDYGGHAEYANVPVGRLLELPDSMSYEVAAAIPVNYLTAWLMLFEVANLRKGDRVLIHAVGGGVGQAALQLCKWKEAEVYGTASASKHERLKSLGVDHCIDYHHVDFQQEIMRLTNDEGVDIALDALGGRNYKKSFDSLAPLGKLVMYGVSALITGYKVNYAKALFEFARSPTFKPLQLLNSNKSVGGLSMGHLGRKFELSFNCQEKVLELVEQGVLAPVVDKVFKFEQGPEAHRYIQDRRNFGKVLFMP